MLRPGLYTVPERAGWRHPQARLACVNEYLARYIHPFIYLKL